MSLRFPPSLRPGDTVAVVAPASPFERGDLERGVAWLRERYDVRVDPSVLSRHGYLAGDDGRRAAELVAAMEDAGVRAIIAARGGYGTMRILDALPWQAWAERPSWLVGFSDITALHVEAWRRGVATMHAPHVTGLGRDEHPTLHPSWRDALELPTRERTWEALEILHPGPRATGTLVGGNLSLLAAMAAAGRLVVPEGAVLAIEDVTERPYRIDRMLTSLRIGGHLLAASAIVFGDFQQCEPGPDKVTALDVLVERTAGLGIPVVAGAPFGHGARNDAFVIGAPTLVEGRFVVLNHK
jgi:muramoyltetrapeptide carboxypeptidase